MLFVLVLAGRLLVLVFNSEHDANKLLKRKSRLTMLYVSRKFLICAVVVVAFRYDTNSSRYIGINNILVAVTSYNFSVISVISPEAYLLL